MKFNIGAATWPGLSKLIEESGEVLQVAGKIIATDGALEHWDGTNLKERLEDELADQRAASLFVIQQNNLDEKRIERRAADKLAIFNRWHDRQKKTACICDTLEPKPMQLAVRLMREGREGGHLIECPQGKDS